jgi:hypothetical protein
MTINFGKVAPGKTLYIPFASYDSQTPTEMGTISAFALADIKVFKDGGTTERASTSGFTLLDTDGIDFSGETGINGFSISLADNTTAQFWAAGSQYWVVVGPITLDAATTIRAIPAVFEIGYEGAILDTYMATRASQTSFTLNKGPAEADALNGSVCLIHDLASEVQLQYGVVLDYAVTTKTVTLAADPGVFTTAQYDNVSFFPPSGVFGINGSRVIGNGTSGNKWRG